MCVFFGHIQLKKKIYITKPWNIGTNNFGYEWEGEKRKKKRNNKKDFSK